MSKLKDLDSPAYLNYKSELKVLAGLQKLSNEGIKPYLNTITDETGLTRKVALRAIGELLRAGLITAGNTRIENGRWVRVYLIAGEGRSLAEKILSACYD